MVAIALWLMVDWTRLGAMIRAGVDDPPIARVVGIKVSQLFTLIFCLGAALAAFACVMGAPYLSVYPGLDFEMLPLALIVVILGGTGSLLGALVGSFLIGFLFSAKAGAAPAPAASSANDVVDNVQKFYKDIKQVTASFRQTVHISTFGTDKTSDGTVWLMKPGKMRWDYLEKKKAEVQVKKSFISNGTNLYVVEHDNKQVVKKNLQQDLMPVAVSFLYGKGDLKAEFNAEIDKSGKYGGKDDIVLRLSPKQPSAQYKNLFLVVSPSDFHVTQSVIVDA